MKKILVASAAFLLVAGAVDTAPAAESKPGVELSGDARVRAVYRDDFDFGNSDKDGENYLDSRIRLTIKGTAAGGAYAIGRIRMMETKFEDNDTDNAAGTVEPGNIWMDKAYIGVPFSDNFTLEAGKYRVTYGTGFFYEDLNLAGLRGIIKAGNVEINPFVEWMSEGQNSKIKQDKNDDNDSVRFGANISADFNDNWKGGVLVAYQTDDRAETVIIDDVAHHMEPNEGLLASVYFEGKEGNFGLAGEFAYADGDLRGFNQFYDDHNDSGIDMIGWDDDGYGGYLQPSYTIDALTLALNVGFTMDGFLADPVFGFVMLGADHSLTVMSMGEHGDWLWAGLVAKYAVSDKLNLTGNLVYASVDGYSNTGLDSLESAIEVSGVLEYTISKGAVFSWFAGTLIPSFDDPTVEDDPAFGTYGRLQLKF
ncbi:MAG: hypothetical protein HQQ73_03835 [Desulfobulbaceae bacterium]|nr:hypothetical protein [Desulfobulbaceae bacterium]